MHYIIDCQTSDKRRIIARLSRLKSTITVSDGGVYRDDTTLSQIRLESTSSERDIDDWLWKTGFDYVGVVDVTGKA